MAILVQSPVPFTALFRGPPLWFTALFRDSPVVRWPCPVVHPRFAGPVLRFTRGSLAPLRGSRPCPVVQPWFGGSIPGLIRGSQVVSRVEPVVFLIARMLLAEDTGFFAFQRLALIVPTMLNLGESPQKKASACSPMPLQRSEVWFSLAAFPCWPSLAQ